MGGEVGIKMKNLFMFIPQLKLEKEERIGSLPVH